MQRFNKRSQDLLLVQLFDEHGQVLKRLEKGLRALEDRMQIGEASAADIKEIHDALSSIRWFVRAVKYVAAPAAVLVGAYHAGGEIVLQVWKLLRGGL